MREDRRDRHRLSMLHGPSIIIAAFCARRCSPAPATSDAFGCLLAKATASINKSHTNSNVGTNSSQKQADMIKSK